MLNDLDGFGQLAVEQPAVFTIAQQRRNKIRIKLQHLQRFLLNDLGTAFVETEHGICEMRTWRHWIDPQGALQNAPAFFGSVEYPIKKLGVSPESAPVAWIECGALAKIELARSIRRVTPSRARIVRLVPPHCARKVRGPQLRI